MSSTTFALIARRPSLTLAGLLLAMSATAQQDLLQDLKGLSLEELANVQVTSVSKIDQPLREAAASIYVITRDEILRSGATLLPEMLRLAPNLHVARTGAADWVVSARGFTGSNDAQNFANKLLVLIDGRSVYSPLFSGVYWETLTVLPEDIDRIEVISGPGGTAWGANAVHGVINIQTRRSSETQGGVAFLGVGSQERTASARYGGELPNGGTYRVYAKGVDQDSLRLRDGRDAEDQWHKAQLGFRLDGRQGEHDWTLQGDVYRGSENFRHAVDTDISGHNLLARWQYSPSAGSVWQLQGWVDEMERRGDPPGTSTWVRMVDLELQHNWDIAPGHALVWGIDRRHHDYELDGTPVFYFEPSRDRTELTSAFVSHDWALTERLATTLGVKVESGPYNDLEPLPSLRVRFVQNERATWWASASRAIRSATPFDRHVQEVAAGRLFIVGDPDYRDEELVAYEVGYRGRPSAATDVSITLFHHRYDQLRSIEVNPLTVLPLQWGNRMYGESQGLEMWGSWRISDNWTVDGGFTTLDKDLQFKRGASGLLGVAQVGNDPAWQATVKTTVKFAPTVTLHAWLRYVDDLPEPEQQGYAELNARLGWQVRPTVELALVGTSLLDRRHPEYTYPGRIETERSLMVSARWSF